LAVSLLDRNPFPLAREALAGTLLDSAFLAEMVEEQEDRALRDMAKARPLIEARATSRELTARYWIILATIDLWRQHYPDALAEAQRAAAILPQADTLDALSLRSQALTVQADMLFNSANPAASLPVYRAALVPLERAVQLYPRNALAHRRLANLLQNFGQSLPGAKEPREAPAILRRAIAEDETLVAFDSDDTDAPRNLNIARESLAAALIGIHDYAGGFAQFQQTEDTMRAAWLTRPGEERLLRDYAVVVGNYADELGANGRFAVACTKWPLSLDLYGQIDRKGHLSAQDRTIFVARMTESQRLHCK
jgi:tetratricopeptide (TPR) repeat protein